MVLYSENLWTCAEKWAIQVVSIYITYHNNKLSIRSRKGQTYTYLYRLHAARSALTWVLFPIYLLDEFANISFIQTLQKSVLMLFTNYECFLSSLSIILLIDRCKQNGSELNLVDYMYFIIFIKLDDLVMNTLVYGASRPARASKSHRTTIVELMPDLELQTT